MRETVAPAMLSAFTLYGCHSFSQGVGVGNSMNMNL